MEDTVKKIKRQATGLRDKYLKVTYLMEDLIPE